MYDPARDCFTAADAEAAAAAAAEKANANSSSPMSSPVAPSTKLPPPISTFQSPGGGLPPLSSPYAPTPGVEGMISFDFHGGMTRRMSRIDDLLSPAPTDEKGGGYFRGGNERYSPEERGPELPPITPSSPLQPKQQEGQKKQAAEGGAATVAPEKRKLPSFKRKFTGDDAGTEKRPTPVDRDRYRDRNDRRDDDRRGAGRGSSRDREGRERDERRPARRQRTRSPTSRRDQRDPYASASRRRSRSPPPSREKFPQRTASSRSPPAHLRLLSSNLPREPSPPPPLPSPPRATRKLPGRASRLTQAEREAARQLQLRKEQPQEGSTGQNGPLKDSLPVEDVVRSHYNEKREMGKQWRVESSRIKGLRSFNNWIKSCIIQKFSPNPALAARLDAGGRGDGMRYGGIEEERLCILDIGCGKGGDLLKWKLAPQEVGIYVGVDTAEVSVAQARDRYESMSRESRGRGGYRDRDRNRGPPSSRIFRAEFAVRDCWVSPLPEIPVIREIGFDPAFVDPIPRHGGGGRWGAQGGFDCVSLMFCMHYAFESEAKCRRMLANVAGALKKGGRFFGTVPSSDVIKGKLMEMADKVAKQREKEARKALGGDKDGGGEKGNESEEKEEGEEEAPIGEWGNSIYKVKFGKDVLDRIIPPTPPTPPTDADSAPPPPLPPPPPPPKWDGRFRPMWGWRYSYFLEEAVDAVPEYVVPWESFRGLCEDYNLELIYKKGFHDIWREEGERRGDRGEREERGSLGALSERMGVRDRDGKCAISPEEWEACGFYLAFAFRKS